MRALVDVSAILVGGCFCQSATAPPVCAGWGVSGLSGLPITRNCNAPFSWRFVWGIRARGMLAMRAAAPLWYIKMEMHMGICSLICSRGHCTTAACTPHDHERHATHVHGQMALCCLAKAALPSSMARRRPRPPTSNGSLEMACATRPASLAQHPSTSGGGGMRRWQWVFE